MSYELKNKFCCADQFCLPHVFVPIYIFCVGDRLTCQTGKQLLERLPGSLFQILFRDVPNPFKLPDQRLDRNIRGSLVRAIENCSREVQVFLRARNFFGCGIGLTDGLKHFAAMVANGV